MSSIRLKTADRTCLIQVGEELSPWLAHRIREEVRDGRLFVFYDAQFYALYGRRFRAGIRLAGRRVCEFVVPSGEKAKSPGVLAGLYDFLLHQKITRSDFILACGGGVTTDLVGYAAATVLRGVRWGAVATTLVGMVDAAIGGKTGINHRLGKNLVGAFWQPSFVCCDVRFLATLEQRHMIAGLGEALKCGGLVGGKMLRPLKAYLASDDLYDMKRLARLVSTSAAYKASVVSRDERESGPRAVLNFGHTVGHGIEKALGYGRLLHGEAVTLGIHAALLLGTCAGYESNGLHMYQKLVEQSMRRLPRRRIDPGKVLAAMELDKKRSGRKQRFVLLKQIGRPTIRDDIDRRSVRSALNETLARFRVLGGKDA